MKRQRKQFYACWVFFFLICCEWNENKRPLELFVVVCKHSSDQSVYEKACNIDFRLAQCFVVVCLVAGAQKVSTHNSIFLLSWKIYFKKFFFPISCGSPRNKFSWFGKQHHRSILSGFVPWFHRARRPTTENLLSQLENEALSRHTRATGAHQQSRRGGRGNRGAHPTNATPTTATATASTTSTPTTYRRRRGNPTNLTRRRGKRKMREKAPIQSQKPHLNRLHRRAPFSMKLPFWTIFNAFFLSSFSIPLQQDSNSLKDHLLANSHRSIRIANQQELQQRQQRKQQKIAARRNSGGESGCDENSNSKANNSPSPRSKHNRKQAKGNLRHLNFANLVEEIFIPEFRSSSRSVTLSNRHSVAGRTKSIPSTETGTTSSGSHQSTLSSASFLLPKMQAEQGSIGELQKYHSRYLKNRRHTLANVR